MTEVVRKQGAVRRGWRDRKAQIWSYTKARFENKTVTKGLYRLLLFLPLDEVIGFTFLQPYGFWEALFGR